MSRRKGIRIRRMAAVLLSAVLITGMLWDAVPVTVLAQETTGQQEDADGSGTEPAAGDTKPEEKTETAPAEGTGSEGQEKTDPEGQEEPGTTEGGGETEDGDGLTGQEPGDGTEERPQEPGGGTEEGQPKPGDGTEEEQPKPGDITEEETEPGTVGGNDAAPQRVMMAAPAPQVDGQRDVTFTFKIYGYNPDKFPLELNNVVVIWSKNAEEFIEGEENKKAVTEEGYTCWSYTFRNLDVNTRYEVKEKNASGQMYTIPTGSGTEYERIDYAVNFYDGNELKGVQYVTSGNYTWEHSAPVLTKDDCTFAGWVTADGGKDAFDFKTAITQITNVYASWTPNTPSGTNIASGTDWVLDKDGKLTISSDAGMEGWIANGRNNHSSKVTSAGILDGVTRIPGAAFNGCSGMKSITISENVTSIGAWAFNDCSSLTGITIPSKVGEIGNAAFGDCGSLTTVTMRCETPPTVGTDAFYGCKFVTDKSQGIHVPKGKAQTYKDAWTAWAAYIADDAPTPPVEKHEHNDVTFTAWTATDSLPTAAGNYYLTENVTLSDTWSVPSGETTLCLNGKSIKQTTENVWAVSIGSGSTLKLYDCGKVGKITREVSQSTAGSVSVSNGGILYMYGGNISDTTSYSPAVYVNKGEFHMNGGKIAGNRNNSTDVSEDRVFGGGVNVCGGKFWMEGGEISDNYKCNEFGNGIGGGVCLLTGSVFRMSGGKIAGNTVGIYVHKSEIHMSGGEVTGNTAGGGISLFSGATMTAGGNIFITGNTDKNEKEKNLFISLGTITIDPDNSLSGSANIGVTTGNAPTEGNPVNITGANSADYSSYFTSDNPDYEIVNGDNNVVQLAVKSQSHTHDYGEWQHDDTQHWKACSCGEETDRAAHDFDDWVTDKPATETEAGTKHRDCQTCGYSQTENIPAAGEKYTVTVNSGTGGGDYAAGDTVTIRANAPASGKQFDKWEVNSGSVTLISATSSTTTFTMPAEAVTVTATYKNKSGGGHSGGGSGSGNSGGSGNADGGDNNNGGGNADGGNNNNGGSDNGSGSSGGNGGTGAGTSKAPGAGQPKVKQEKEGNIRKEVRVEGEDTLDATVETPLSELADMVLTKEEKQKAAGGTDIRIVLDVKDASAVVSAADKTLVEKALNGPQAKGYTLGQYLEINLFKVIGNSRSAITETNGKLTVTIDVPDSLRNADGTKTRIFAVIRVHNGKAELLPDLDSNADTITIKTDRFSTYAVVYKDTAGGNGDGAQSESGKPGVIRVSTKSDGKNSDGGKDGEPKTEDRTPLELSATLAMIAGLTYLLLYFADRRHGMTEETKKELVSGLIAWAKRGGKGRTYLALAAIFVLLVYYHSIGKKIGVSSIQKQLTF